VQHRSARGQPRRPSALGNRYGQSWETIDEAHPVAEAERWLTSPNFDDLFDGDNRVLAAALIEITNDLREYWPLTVRQIYYQVVARLLVPNEQNQYKRVSRVLTTLRREDVLDWAAVEDRTRRTIDKRGVSDLQAWAAEQM